MARDPGAGWATEARAELDEGMAHEKCYACGCMHDGLTRLESVLEKTGTDPEFLTTVRAWQDQLDAVEVDCRGCSHCFPAEATNLAMDGVEDPQLLTTDAAADENLSGIGDQSSGSSVPGDEWPRVPGDYHEMCTGTDCPVAVSTLGDPGLAEAVADRAPDELCIVGPTRTENTGIEKLVRNVVTNPSIQILVLAGPDPAGHRSGETLQALLEEGVTGEMQVSDAPGRRPVLANATATEIEAFREQIDIVDRIGCTDPEQIVETVVAVSERACTCGECVADPVAVPDATVVEADPDEPVQMDPAGYFVVLPRQDEQTIVCEHYDYDHTRQHVIVGESAQDVYRDVIERDLVSRQDHAAYLGAELTKAELALSEGLDYEQDGKPE